MRFFNHFVNKLFDIFLLPCNYLWDIVAIMLISLLTALIALIAYKYLSDSEKIKRTKGYIKGNILAIRLYKDFALEIVLSFFKSLWHILRYFMLNFVPLIVLIPVLFPVFLQMDLRYGFRPFNVGETIDVKLKLNKNFFDQGGEVGVKSSLVKEFKSPVYIPALNEVSLRVQGAKKGFGTISFICGEDKVNKSISIEDKSSPSQGLSSWKGKYSFYKSLLNPLEDSVKKGSIEEISINYPRKKIPFLFFNTYWWVYYLILVFIFALALKKKFNVEF